MFDHDYSLNIYNINKILIENHFKEQSIINLNHKMIRLINVEEYRKRKIECELEKMKSISRNEKNLMMNEDNIELENYRKNKMIKHLIEKLKRYMNLSSSSLNIMIGEKRENRFFDAVFVIFYCNNKYVIRNELYKIIKLINKYYFNKRVKIYNTFCMIEEFLRYYKCIDFSKNILEKSNHILSIFTN